MIGVAPGSVWGTKRWTKEGFVELIRIITGETEAAVILLGSGTEKQLCAEIVRDLGHGGSASDPGRMLDLSGVTSLDDLCRVVPRLTALVCNDSAPLHYASAFDTPTVAMFGATIPEMGFGPLATMSRTLGVELDCRPCSDHGPQVCPKQHFRCMREISPRTVFAALTSMMAYRRCDG
jgi:heptosyltransferase-2